MSKDQNIDMLHAELVEAVSADISECLDAGNRLRLSPGEVTGVCTAALIQAVAHLMVISGTPEHVFMTWCHDQYLAMQKFCGEKQN